MVYRIMFTIYEYMYITTFIRAGAELTDFAARYVMYIHIIILALGYPSSTRVKRPKPQVGSSVIAIAYINVNDNVSLKKKKYIYIYIVIFMCTPQRLPFPQGSAQLKVFCLGSSVVVSGDVRARTTEAYHGSCSVIS
jgi:hypothetical protein